MQSLNLTTGLIESIFDFNGIVEKLLVDEGTIIISTSNGFLNGKIYSIDKNTRELVWEKDIYNKGIRVQTKVAQYSNSLFYIDMQKDIKNVLVEVDMKTGDIINKIRPNESIWPQHIDFVKDSLIEFDGENILIFGDQLFTYNVITKEMTNVVNRKDHATVNYGKLIYRDKNVIYSLDINKKTTKSIYKLGKKDVYQIFAYNEYILLVLADDVREALADNKEFTYVMLHDKK